jgi:hypothetical protein
MAFLESLGYGGAQTPTTEGSTTDGFAASDGTIVDTGPIDPSEIGVLE